MNNYIININLLENNFLNLHLFNDINTNHLINNLFIFTYILGKKAHTNARQCIYFIVFLFLMFSQ